MADNESEDPQLDMTAWVCEKMENVLSTLAEMADVLRDPETPNWYKRRLGEPLRAALHDALKVATWANGKMEAWYYGIADKPSQMGTIGLIEELDKAGIHHRVRLSPERGHDEDRRPSPASYSKGTPMNPDIKVVASNLQRDIDVLVAALKSCEQALEEVKARYPNSGFQLRSDASLAIWAYYRFGGDWSKFVEFTCQAVDAHPEDDKSQLWVMSSPLEESPERDALRHMDRLFMALGMVSRELAMRVPETVPVREYRNNEPEIYERVQTFVQAANEVLNPQPPVRRIPRL